uniref:Uncharacterized protein n=1 Tax=Pseudomonas phage HRDY3 TaxID=3236930 RepID=A0AB39CE83_9VIRU
MFNASGIVQNILNGSLTYTDLLRDINTVQQTTSNSIGADYFVNLLAAMGCRMTLDGDKIVTVPFEAHASVVTPVHMRAATPDLQFVKAEPFVMLPSQQEIFARVEILLPEQLTVVAFREVLPLSKALAIGTRQVPSQMVCFPVMSLKDGKVKLVRMSYFSFVKSAAALTQSNACTIIGHHSRKRIQPCTANLNHSFDVEQATIEAQTALEALRAEYEQANTLNYAQACTLRSLLDTRKREAKAIQTSVSAMNAAPKGKAA